MREKKVRGRKRKTIGMVKQIEENTALYPTEFYNGYWHMHLPVGQGFISGGKTPGKIKRLSVQTLVDRVTHLISIKPDNKEKYRVVAAINLPDLWNSQLIVFKGDEYFEGFFDRNSAYQKWIPLSDYRDIQAEWGLTVREGLNICGFEEVIDDEDGYYESEIWFVGELE